MGARHYKHKETGSTVAVAEGSALEAVVVDSRAYDEIEAPPTDEELEAQLVAIANGGGTSPADRDEHDGGWITSPGVPPAPITGGRLGVPPATDTAPAPQPAGQGDAELEAILAAAYEVDTVEGVNGYLDDHPEHVAAVMAREAERKPNPRTGIVEGRHGQAAAAAAGE